MNKVEISGVNTSKLPLLTAEEKVELLKKSSARRQNSKRNIY